MPTKKTQDMIQELFMHVSTCSECGSLQPIACETGRTMAYAWLTYAAAHGDGQAQTILDGLREGKWDNESLFPPGTEIRRV